MRADDRLPPAQTLRHQLALDPSVRYLNYATFGPSLRDVLTAERDARRAMNADFSRYFHDRYMEAGFAALMEEIADFVGCDPNELALVSGTTEAMNTVARGLALEPGDEVLTTSHDHPAGVYPWLLAARERGIVVRQLEWPSPVESADQIVSLFESGITERTRVLSFCHVNYTDGCRLPVERLCGLARRHGAVSVVDGAQAPGMLELHVDRLGCDVYAASLHKWLGGVYGTGFLYVRRAVQPRILPLMVESGDGWRENDRYERPIDGVEIDYRRRWPVAMRRYATNFHYYGPLFGALHPAIQFHYALGRGAIERRILGLARDLRDRLEGLDGVTLLGPAAEPLGSGIVSFRPVGMRAEDLYLRLARQHGIIGRSITHAAIGFDAMRFCTHIFNDEHQLDDLVDILARELRAGG
jgi:selenocysteine lyase/cysteine desulfurase